MGIIKKFKSEEECFAFISKVNSTNEYIWYQDEIFVEACKKAGLIEEEEVERAIATIQKYGSQESKTYRYKLTEFFNAKKCIIPGNVKIKQDAYGVRYVEIDEKLEDIEEHKISP